MLPHPAACSSAPFTERLIEMKSVRGLCLCENRPESNLLRHISEHNLLKGRSQMPFCKTDKNVKGERHGWLDVSDVITVRSRPFFRDWSHVFLVVFFGCMFQILVQTEVVLLRFRCGLQTGESLGRRRSFFPAGEQDLLWRHTEHINALGRGKTFELIYESHKDKIVGKDRIF